MGNGQFTVLLKGREKKNPDDLPSADGSCALLLYLVDQHIRSKLMLEISRVSDSRIIWLLCSEILHLLFCQSTQMVKL